LTIAIARSFLHIGETLASYRKLPLHNTKYQEGKEGAAGYAVVKFDLK